MSFVHELAVARPHLAGSSAWLELEIRLGETDAVDFDAALLDEAFPFARGLHESHARERLGDPQSGRRGPHGVRRYVVGYGVRRRRGPPLPRTRIDAREIGRSLLCGKAS